MIRPGSGRPQGVIRVVGYSISNIFFNIVPLLSRNHSPPFGRPSLDSSNGWSRDGYPQGIITTYRMILSCVSLILINPKNFKFCVMMPLLDLLGKS
jgi:hypothetical protein